MWTCEQLCGSHWVFAVFLTAPPLRPGTKPAVEAFGQVTFYGGSALCGLCSYGYWGLW